MAKILNFDSPVFHEITNRESDLFDVVHSDLDIETALFYLGSDRDLKKYYTSPITNKEKVISDTYELLKFFFTGTRFGGKPFRNHLEKSIRNNDNRSAMLSLVYLVGYLMVPMEDQCEEARIQKAVLRILINIAKSFGFVTNFKVDEEP